MEQTHMGKRITEFFRARGLTATFAVLAVLSTGVLIGSTLTGKVLGAEQDGAKVDTSDASPLRVPAVNHTDNNEFAKIAKMVGPAVVKINTESLPKQSTAPNAKRGQRRGQPNPGDQGDMQDFFNRFFGGQGGDGDDDGDGGGSAGGGKREALGSGFIVDPRGYIITNNHVVEKADRIYVKLSTDSDSDNDPGRPAHVVGTDKETDIAVIKIDPVGTLPTVKLGNSESEQVGDWVLAIGSPFGLTQTVSAGIISATNRQAGEGPASQFQKFLQTDAAINPGNSGGPLVNMHGEVVGVNTAIFTQSMGSQGVGFAVPSNTVVDVYNMLIAPEHKVIRGSIGIQYQPVLSSAVGRVYGFSKGGVLIGVVAPGQPADKAGLRPKDVIVAIDGKPVKDGDDLVANISPRRPGSTVQITYLRGDKQATVTVAIADRAKTSAAFASGGDSDNDDTTATPDNAGSQGKLGLTPGPVPPQLQAQQGLHGGAYVTAVTTGSFADEIGIERGDVILEMNRKPITDVASLNQAASTLKTGDDVVFVVRKRGMRDKSNTFVGGTLR